MPERFAVDLTLQLADLDDRSPLAETGKRPKDAYYDYPRERQDAEAATAGAAVDATHSRVWGSGLGRGAELTSQPGIVVRATVLVPHVRCGRLGGGRAAVVVAAAAAAQGARRRMRLIQHPNYRNMSLKEAEEALAPDTVDLGETIIRPSSRSSALLIATVKVGPKLYMHIGKGARLGWQVIFFVGVPPSASC